MRILVLAPHPYFQVRGSPIDLDNLLRALSNRPDTRVDLLTYAEGEDRDHPGVSMHRIVDLPFTRGIRTRCWPTTFLRRSIGIPPA